jgi:hypothetical protein
MLKLINNNKTDKNTTHSYIELYEELLHNKRYTAKNILEIGIQRGGSIKLWHDYFTNATIYGLDIIPLTETWDKILCEPRIKLGRFDAYDETFFNENFLGKVKFDMMLDDGPHSLDSMKQFIQLYSQVMADDGILIIEDVQSMDWLDELKNAVPEDLKKYVSTYDLRYIKNRYDDIVFVINKQTDTN